MNVYIGTSGELKNAYIGEYRNIQTFDFQNNGSLNWVGYNIGYGTPVYVTNQGWTINNTTDDVQGGIKPPTSIFQGTLKRIKIYWYKPGAITLSKGWAVGICNTNESSLIDFSRQGTSKITIYPGGSIISATDITGEITSEYIFEDNGHITLKLNGTSYDVGSYVSSFQTIWNNQELQIVLGTWDSSPTDTAPNLYVRKVEITTE